MGACTWAHYARNNVAYKRGFAYWVNEGKGKQRGGDICFPFALSVRLFPDCKRGAILPSQKGSAPFAPFWFLGVLAQYYLFSVDNIGALRGIFYTANAPFF